MDFLLWLAVIVIAVIVVRQLSKLAKLRDDLRLLSQETGRLHDRLEALKKELTAVRQEARTGAQTTEAPAPAAAEPEPSAISCLAEVSPPTVTAPQPVSPPPPMLTVEPVREAAPPPVAPSPIGVPAPAATSTAGELGPAVFGRMAAAAPPPVSPAPPPPPRAAAPPPPPPPPPAPFDWERLVGVKLFSWIAGIALVLGAVFFLKYSVEHGWLSAPIRMAIGILVGAGLLVACELKAARRYQVTANALDAAGIAILFSTFFAAHALWHLLGALAAFVLMAVVTAVAVLLSIRRDSLFIALLGLVGGFATPALLSTGQDRPIGLFSYLILLNAGLAWVAYRKRWPHLTTLSAVFTTLYQWAWVMKFLTTGKLPLAMGIFLVFPIVSFVAISLGERRREGAGLSSLFRQTSAVSVALPLLFALYMAVVPAYGQRYWLLFGFLFLVDLGLAAIAAKRGPEELHLVAGCSTVLVFCVWFGFCYRSAAWPAVLGIVAVFALFYPAVSMLLHRTGRAFRALGERATFAAPLLLFAFPILAAIEPAAASPGPLFGVLFGLMATLALFAVAREQGAIHFMAAFFALAAEAVWSARHLTPGRLLAALLIYAGFALFYLGVPILARRLNKRLRPEGAGAILLFASLGLLFFLAAGPVAAAALWGIGLLLLVLNAGLFFEGGCGRHPLLSIAGIVLSWIVLAVWWFTAAVASMLVPALVVMAGFAMLVLGGNIWAGKSAQAGSQTIFSSGLFLGLVGHLFLLFVAAQPRLSVPPWPLLGVLAVLDLAIGVTVLYARRGGLYLAALGASQLILMVWQVVADAAAWSTVAVISAGALALFGVVWFLLARRLKIADDTFAYAAIVAILAGQSASIQASAAHASPHVGLLTVAHVGFLLALLAVTWLTQWHMLAPIAVIPAAVAVATWSAAHFQPELWLDELLFAGAIYIVFLGYPLVLGRRTVRFLHPYLAAALAGAPFFFLARHSLMKAGFGGQIGALPVIQAACMAVLLLQLLVLEPHGKRWQGRLAMVAGTALAFITVAIPLQIEKQWLTIGWALEAAALAWLYRKIPHKGLLGWTAALLVAAFVRLAMNPSVLHYHPRGATPLWNWYLYTYLVAGAAFFATARLLRHRDAALFPPLPAVSKLAVAGGTVLLFLLLNIEIADYYSAGPSLTFNFSAGLAQDLSYTIGWALFALTLLAAGIAFRSTGGRVSAIVLLVITVMKCFLHDLWRLGGLYRVASFVGLAICLSLVALALQKFVLAPQKEAQ